MATMHTTREGWLMDAITHLRPMFEDIDGLELPDRVLVSVGVPYKSRKAIGQCWVSEVANGVNTVFIHPKLRDEVIVLATLVHELIHAGLNCEDGHRKRFKSAALALGLEGKMTSTVAGEELTLALKNIVDVIGPYPHEAFVAGAGVPGGGKQSTRMLKLVANGVCCEYTVRTTQKWIDEGMPFCPCGNEMMLEVK